MKYLYIEICLKVCALSKKTVVRIQIKEPSKDSLFIGDYEGIGQALFIQPLSQGSLNQLNDLDYLEKHLKELGGVTIINEGIEIKTYPSFETFCKEKDIQIDKKLP